MILFSCNNYQKWKISLLVHVNAMIILFCTKYTCLCLCACLCVFFSGLEGERGRLIKEVSEIRPDIVVNGWHSGLWSKVLSWILFLSQILPRHLPAFARYRCQLTGLRYECLLEKREWSWMLVKGNKDLSNLKNGGFWLYWGSRQKK